MQRDVAYLCDYATASTCSVQLAGASKLITFEAHHPASTRKMSQQLKSFEQVLFHQVSKMLLLQQVKQLATSTEQEHQKARHCGQYVLLGVSQVSALLSHLWQLQH